MLYNRKAENYTLECSSRTFSANCGIIGISPSGSLTEGYDGHIYLSPSTGPITKEERLELADYMISVWEKFKDLSNEEY